MGARQKFRAPVLDLSYGYLEGLDAYAYEIQTRSYAQRVAVARNGFGNQCPGRSVHCHNCAGCAFHMELAAFGVNLG